MQFNVNILQLVVCLFVVSACSGSNYYTEKELAQYCQTEEHGLSVIKEVNGINVGVSYRPTDLLVAQVLHNKPNPSLEEVSKYRKKYGDYYYFVLSLSRDKKELLSPSNQGLVGFSNLLQTISFKMSDKANLTSGKDTIEVADCMYSRTFSLSKSTDVLFVFDKSKTTGKETVRFNLDEFGLGIGQQFFEFKTSDLDNTPKIFQP